MLKNIAVAYYPALYQARMLEVEAERTKWKSIFPVFLYNAIMFPGEMLSLHLFEPRYKVSLNY